MSYDIALVDKNTKQILELPFKIVDTGGNYCVGGKSEASLNITYNYYKHYRKVFANDDGIRTIYGMTGKESIIVLKDAIDQLGDDIDDDYWSPTEGNAKEALKTLYAFAILLPDGVWSGD